ncbi:MAG: hypothetical protein LBI74_08665 [Synergistaceae bacterium]|jgi:hypothetical protein|nr:hypothetical protein [Synergistaceae bacterium]
MRGYARFSVLLVTAVFVMFAARPVFANLSAQKAFTLIRSVPPGERIESAARFLGTHLTERSINNEAGIKVRQWGRQEDEWFLELLHDGNMVMASRITWRTKTKRDQQTTFSQLTTAGRKYFGRVAKFRGMTEAEWMEAGGTLLVRAVMKEDISGGVTLLTGVRDRNVDSGKYGF